MIKIGILSQKDCDEIAREIQSELLIQNKNVMILDDDKSIISKSEFLKDKGIDYLIIKFDFDNIFPIFLDILVLENQLNNNIISYPLVDCVRDNTYLVYNTDFGYLPIIEHPKAIDYGLYPNSMVSFSSIDYNNNSLSVLLSIQRPFENFFGKIIEIGEYRIKTKNNIVASNLIPASICTMLLSEL